MRALLLYLGLAVSAAAAPGNTANRVLPFESAAELTSNGWVDDLTFAQWKRLGIEASPPCSDAVFLRRAFLDVIGELPTAQEAAAFLSDPNPRKRAALIDALLARPEFADYWSMRWSDLLRIKSEFPINLWPNAVQAYYRWVHTAIRDNMPYDHMARSLLLSTGSNFRAGEVNFYRAVPAKEPPAIAQAVALTFMGARAAGWPAAKLDGMAAFFSQLGYKSTQEWKEEIVFFDQTKPAPTAAIFPDGRAAKLKPGEDPRVAFTDWLMAPSNPWFAKAIVNRIWYWLLGRGIVDPPDDIRDTNPPANPELLARLERELLDSHYDLRHIYRVILNSQTYQLSSITRDRRPEAAANFAAYPVRRLDAETLIDAICQITGSTEDYSSPIPEPFTFLPEGTRSTALPDGSIGSAFLDLFGRPPRDTGLASERNNSISTEQRLHLLNSSHIQLKIQQSAKLRNLLTANQGAAAVSALYLTILSRDPMPEELTTVAAYFQTTRNNRWQAAQDLSWALVNSAEFLERH